MSITADQIKLSCSTAVGKANDTLDVSTIGADVEIGFNNKFICTTKGWYPTMYSHLSFLYHSQQFIFHNQFLSGREITSRKFCCQDKFSNCRWKHVPVP